MNSKITEVIFLLDKSGSMHGLEESTIQGYEEFIDSQRKEEGTCLVTTCFFSDTLMTIHSHQDIHSIPPMKKKTTYPKVVRHCMTASDISSRISMDTLKGYPKKEASSLSSSQTDLKMHPENTMPKAFKTLFQRKRNANGNSSSWDQTLTSRRKLKG